MDVQENCVLGIFDAVEPTKTKQTIKRIKLFAEDFAPVEIFPGRLGRAFLNTINFAILNS